jgi:general stress protein 26
MAEERTTVGHLTEMLEGFDTAMLVTFGGDALYARPMAIAEVRGEGTLYFATDLESPKVKQLEANPRVGVVLQDGDREIFLSGYARVSTDRRLSDRLWSEAWKIWFPKGKDDPTLCILIVEPETAEYWDRSGAKGLKFLFNAAKAYLTGTQASELEPEAHAKLSL